MEKFFYIIDGVCNVNNQYTTIFNKKVSAATKKVIYEETDCRITYQTGSEWEDGLEGQFIIENLGTDPLENRRFQLEYQHKITSIWDGEIYISIWKHESAFTTDEYYDEELKLYQDLQNEITLKNYVSADRILFTPIVEKGICYTGVRLIEIKEQEYDPDNIPQFWVVFEETNFIGIMEENGGGMDDILCRHVQKYKETGKPVYFTMWRHAYEKREKTSSIDISNTTIPLSLDCGGILTKFEKLAPYLSYMCMELEANAVIKLIEESFPLPPIDSVHTYVNNLQQNKELNAMGEKLYRQIHKKRGWDDPED